MKKLLSIILAVFCLMLCIGVHADSSDPRGCMLDEMDTVDFKNNKVTGEIFTKYEITFLNLWAVWCPSCVNELGNVNEMYKDTELKDMGVNVLGLFIEDSYSVLSEGKNIVKSFSFTNLRFMNDPQLLNLISNSGDSRPVSYIIDKTGKVIDYCVGAMNKTDMKAFILRGAVLAGAKYYTDNRTLGDATADGKLNTGDATWILKYAAGMIEEAGIDNIMNADANMDGNINTGDATVVLKHCAGLLNISRKVFTLNVTGKNGNSVLYIVETYKTGLRDALETYAIIEVDANGTVVKVGDTEAEEGEAWVLTQNGNVLDINDVQAEDGAEYAFTLVKA